MKLNFITAILRVVFSREKADFYAKPNYEFEFIKSVVKKCMILTKQKYGDKYSCLFRKDEIYDDILKYIFFVFGNNMLVKSFGKSLLI